MLKIKIGSKKENGVGPTKLSVFDFDRTLFKTPERPENFDGNWPASKESLGPPTIPDRPLDNLWNMDVVQAAKKELSDKNTVTVMLTGRIDQFFQDRIEQLLKQKNMNFYDVGLNQFGRSAGEFKIERIGQILSKFPSIKIIEMWEDEQDKIELYTETFGSKYKFKINKADNNG